MTNKEDNEVPSSSRRKFIKKAAAFAAASLAGPAIGTLLGVRIVKEGLSSAADQVRAEGMALLDPEVKRRELQSLPQVIVNNCVRLVVFGNGFAKLGTALAVEQLHDATVLLTARHLAELMLKPEFGGMVIDQPHLRDEKTKFNLPQLGVSISTQTDMDLALISVASPSRLSDLKSVKITSGIPKFPVQCGFLGFAGATREGAKFHAGWFSMDKPWIPLYGNDLKGKLKISGGDSGAPVFLEVLQENSGEGVQEEVQVVGIVTGGIFDTKVEPITDKIYAELKSGLHLLKKA